MKKKSRTIIASLLCVMVGIVFSVPSVVVADTEELDHVHQWETSVIYEPTCTEDGLVQYYCVDCYESYEEAIPASGKHSWLYDYTEEATCVDKGYKHYYCEDCYDEKTTPIAATGKHEWSGWTTVKGATLTAKGKKSRYCEECGKEQTAAINKLKPFIKLSGKISMNAKTSRKLNVSYAAGDKVKSWKTSNKKVATVKNGKVTAKKKGKATITVKLKSGKSAKCVVTVKKAAKKKKSSTKRAAKVSSGKVYWTPSGKVYHSTKGCPSLSRSHTIKSGSISKAKSAGKSRQCKNCY